METIIQDDKKRSISYIYENCLMSHVILSYCIQMAHHSERCRNVSNFLTSYYTRGLNLLSNIPVLFCMVRSDQLTSCYPSPISQSSTSHQTLRFCFVYQFCLTLEICDRTVLVRIMKRLQYDDFIQFTRFIVYHVYHYRVL